MTWRVESARVREHEARFARLVRERDVMVQQFLPAVLSEGELSLVFLAGAFSPAVRQRPATRDLRVAEEFGGSGGSGGGGPASTRPAAARGGAARRQRVYGPAGGRIQRVW